MPSTRRALLLDEQTATTEAEAEAPMQAVAAVPTREGRTRQPSARALASGSAEAKPVGSQALARNPATVAPTAGAPAGAPAAAGPAAVRALSTRRKRAADKEPELDETLTFEQTSAQEALVGEEQQAQEKQQEEADAAQVDVDGWRGEATVGLTADEAAAAITATGALGASAQDGAQTHSVRKQVQAAEPEPEAEGGSPDPTEAGGDDEDEFAELSDHVEEAETREEHEGEEETELQSQASAVAELTDAFIDGVIDNADDTTLDPEQVCAPGRCERGPCPALACMEDFMTP